MDTYNASRRQQKEAVRSSELMPCTNQASRCQNSEAHILDLYSRENTKCLRRVICLVTIGPLGCRISPSQGLYTTIT
jgi:hypothetical protein